MNMEISADGAGKQEASEAQTPNFADSFRGSQTPKTHPQILPWMKNVWWWLPASLGLQARKQKARAGQACSSSQESRAQDLFLPTTPLSAPHKNPLRSIPRKWPPSFYLDAARDGQPIASQSHGFSVQYLQRLTLELVPHLAWVLSCLPWVGA